MQEDGGWGEKEDYEHIDETLKYMKKNYNIDRNRMYLAGFSAGGKFVYHVAKNRPNEFHGLASICAMLNNDAKDIVSKVNKKFKFYIVNGEIDNVMPPENGKTSADYLRKNGFKNLVYIEAGGLGHDQPGSIAYKAIQYFEGETP